MSSGNIYPLACHSLNEKAVMAEQGRQGVRKSNTSSNSQQMEEPGKDGGKRGSPQARHLLLGAAGPGEGQQQDSECPHDPRLLPGVLGLAKQKQDLKQQSARWALQKGRSLPNSTWQC